MNCPNCGHGEHRVLRTAEEDEAIARTRECLKCAKRWKTAEVDAERLERANDIIEAYERLGGAVRGT